MTSNSATEVHAEARGGSAASEHLHAAIAVVYGHGTHETRYRHQTLRDTLRDEEGGVDKVIRALNTRANKPPRKTSVATELAYFRKHNKRKATLNCRSRVS